MFSNSLVFYFFFNRGNRRKMPLAVYNEDDTNDLSDLGIGTSSASGKSSLSEDFDNHSVIVSILLSFFLSIHSILIHLISFSLKNLICSMMRICIPLSEKIVSIFFNILSLIIFSLFFWLYCVVCSQNKWNWDQSRAIIIRDMVC